jgi:hypothetical protein
VSKGSYASLNLAQHVGDDPVAVSENRRLLRQELSCASEPCWLQQTHSRIVVPADQSDVEADASYTRVPGQISVVMTADCLPLLVCDKRGTVVASIHAGWRGLALGVIEATLEALATPATELLIWLGPAISQAAFQVGADVYETYRTKDAMLQHCFKRQDAAHWLLDIYAAARRVLLESGVAISDIYGGDHCTYSDSERFFSYRRDSQTGRMASLIYLRT